MEEKNLKETPQLFKSLTLIKEIEASKSSIISGSTSIRNIYDIDNFGLWSLISRRMCYLCKKSECSKMERMMHQLFFCDPISTTLMQTLILQSLEAKSYIVVKQIDHDLRTQWLENIDAPLHFCHNRSPFFVILSEGVDMNNKDCIYINVWTL